MTKRGETVEKDTQGKKTLKTSKEIEAEIKRLEKRKAALDKAEKDRSLIEEMNKKALLYVKYCCAGDYQYQIDFYNNKLNGNERYQNDRAKAAARAARAKQRRDAQRQTESEEHNDSSWY